MPKLLGGKLTICWNVDIESLSGMNSSVKILELLAGSTLSNEHVEKFEKQFKFKLIK